MMASENIETRGRALNPKLVAVNLRLLIGTFGLCCFAFGMNLSAMADDVGRGSVHAYIHRFEFGCGLIALPLIGYCIHLMVRRLLLDTQAL